MVSESEEQTSDTSWWMAEIRSADALLIPGGDIGTVWQEIKEFNWGKLNLARTNTPAAASYLTQHFKSSWARRLASPPLPLPEQPRGISHFSFCKICFVGSLCKLGENTTRQSPWGHTIDLAISVQLNTDKGAVMKNKTYPPHTADCVSAARGSCLCAS